MQPKKTTFVLVLLTFMLVQLALANSYVAHIDHGYSQDMVASHGHHHENNHSKHDDQQKHKHECPECSLSQVLQTAFYHTPTILNVSITTGNSISSQQYYIVTRNRYNLNSPRAPPTIFI